MLQRVEVAAGIKHIGFAAWQGCQQLQIVKLPLQSLAWKMELSKAAMPLGILWPRAVSSTAEGCLRSAALSARLVLAKKQKTAMSLPQGHSWADMLSKAASRSHPSPLQWTNRQGKNAA